MKKCRHGDCSHSHGWTHRGGGGNNKYIDDEFGSFFKFRAGMFQEVEPDRFHEGNPDGLELLGCPKCGRLSLIKETFLDD